MSTERKDWMIWNGRWSTWWRENKCGYTRDIAEAGLYTKAEADRLCRPEESERPVHVTEHAEYLRRSLQRIEEKVRLLDEHWVEHGETVLRDAKRREEDRVSETTATPPSL